MSEQGPLVMLGTHHSNKAPQRMSRRGAQDCVPACLQRGFTVVELVVTMAIAAILIGIGLPAFTTFIAQQNLTSDANAFLGAVAYARSESASRAANVSLQAVGATPDDEWGGGYCVTVGTPGDCNNPLRRFDALDRATFNAIGAIDGVGTLTFDSRGLLTLGAAGQIQLCSTDTLEDPGRALDVSVIGRVSVSRFDCPDP